MIIDEKRLAAVIKSFDSHYHRTGEIPGTDEVDILGKHKDVLEIIHSLCLLFYVNESPEQALLTSITIGFIMGSSYAEVGQLNASLSDKS